MKIIVTCLAITLIFIGHKFHMSFMLDGSVEWHDGRPWFAAICYMVALLIYRHGINSIENDEL